MKNIKSILAITLLLTFIIPNVALANPFRILTRVPEVIQKAPLVIEELLSHKKNKSKKPSRKKTGKTKNSGKVNGPSPTEKKLMNQGKKTRFMNKYVYKRRGLFDPYQKDAAGRTNLERMKAGLAPIGKDGRPIELHHVGQKEKGPIVEMTYTEHQVKYKNDIHVKKESEINRAKFDRWRRAFWRKRSKDFS